MLAAQNTSFSSDQLTVNGGAHKSHAKKGCAAPYQFLQLVIARGVKDFKNKMNIHF
jgi:hypothetical protein